MTVVTVVVIVKYFSKNNSTPQQPMRFSGQLFAILAMFFKIIISLDISWYTYIVYVAVYTAT